MEMYAQLWIKCGWKGGICVCAVKFFDGIFDNLGLPYLICGADVEDLEEHVIQHMKQYRVNIQPKLQKQIDSGDENGRGQSDSMLRLLIVFPQKTCSIYISLML